MMTENLLVELEAIANVAENRAGIVGDVATRPDMANVAREMRRIARGIRDSLAEGGRVLNPTWMKEGDWRLRTTVPVWQQTEAGTFVLPYQGEELGGRRAQQFGVAVVSLVPATSTWAATAIVEGMMRHSSEHEDRSEAFQHARLAMIRAWNISRGTPT